MTRTTFSIGDVVEIVDMENDYERVLLIIVAISRDDVYGDEYLLRFPDGYEHWYEEFEIAYPKDDSQ